MSRSRGSLLHYPGEDRAAAAGGGRAEHDPRRDEYAKEQLLEIFETLVAQKSLDVRFGVVLDVAAKRSAYRTTTWSSSSAASRRFDLLKKSDIRMEGT